MHLVRGLLKGLNPPPTLPRKLTPPKTPQINLPAPTDAETQAYISIFKALDTDDKGVLDGELSLSLSHSLSLSLSLSLS